MRKRPASNLGFVEPLLPTLVEKPPEGGGWTHEIKFDGYRTQFVIDHGRITAFTRNGYDWTQRYAPLVDALRPLDVTSALIDGEVVLAGEHHRPDFHGLRSAITKDPGRLIFMAFDLLHLNGHDLRDMELVERRHLLDEMVQELGPGRVQFSAALEGDADGIFRKIDRAGLEGMVSKKANSKYRSGRSTEWVKAKCYEIDEFAIVGVQRERGKPAMALMANREGEYIGGAFITLPKRIRDRLWERVEARTGARPPKGQKADKGEWLQPGLRGRVKFLRGEEKLRHASLLNFSEGEPS